MTKPSPLWKIRSTDNSLEGCREQFRHFRAAALARGWTSAEFTMVARSLLVDETPEGWVEAAKEALSELADAVVSGFAPESIGGEALARYDVFYRAWNRDSKKTFSEGNIRSQTIFCRTGSLAVILENAWAGGCSFGARGQSGIFEIQGDEGIWKQARGRQMTTDDVGTSRVVFLSWDEMEKIEKAGGIPFSDLEDPTIYEAA